MLDKESSKVVLNLIEKLQKENEELKNKLSLKQFDINVVYNDYLEKLNEYEENSISIQKVKDKIEELKERGESDLKTYGFAVETHLAKQVLQELLEEREGK